MQLTTQNKNKILLFVFTFFCIIILTTYILIIRKNLIEEKEENARIYAESVISTLNLTMEHYIYITEVMKHAYLQDSELFMSRFESYGTWIVHNEDAVVTAYFTDKGVLNKGYPLEMTEDILSIDLFALEEQKQKAIEARDKKKTIIAGPLKVLEGYKGLIIRNPVFVNGEFIGFSTVVLDWKLYEEDIRRNLIKLDQYKVAVRKEISEKVEILEDGYFFSTGKIEDTRIEVPFVMANEQMYLVVDRYDGWKLMGELIPHILIGSCLVLIAFLLVYMYTRNSQRDKQLETERAASEAMSKFLSSMSHDMRTPLNGIIGLLNINIKHPNKHELVYENDCKAYNASQHLLSLINNVLDMNKIASGEISIENVPFNLMDILKDCREMLNVQAVANDIKIYVTYPQDTNIHLIGSPLHLKEVLLNIFSNSIKYNKKNGEVHASVQCMEQTDTHVIYQFKISDTGIGMTKEFIERELYKPFAQGIRTDKIHTIGTGLGMPIVKELVLKMNGTIDVESSVGEGSIFTITLPFEINHVYQDNVSCDKPPVSLSGINMLVVDDIELNLEVAQYILEEAGANITVAYNGKEALELYEQSPVGTYNVILMDVMMPIMNGYEATEAIRNLDREDAKLIPIIALTANAFKDDVEKCINAGMNAHIAKPIDVELLISTINKLL